jgi:hypothetical protein
MSISQICILFHTTWHSHIQNEIVSSFFYPLFTMSVLAFLQDAQDLGLSIELLPLSRPDEEFNMSRFYAVSPHLFLSSKC